MASIYLIRHGQASFGSDDYDKLSELGCRQAEVTGHYLRDCGIHFDSAYSGALLRQRETAELALSSQPNAVTHTVDDRFDEIRNDEHLEYLLPGLMEKSPALKAIVDRGLSSSKDYQKVIDAVFNYWVSPECNVPQIQSWDDYSGGVKAALSDVIRNEGGGKNIAIFTSGGTIATIVAHVLGLSGEQTYQFYEPIFNCSVSHLFYSGDRVSLSYFNDRSFLQERGVRHNENLVTYR